MTLLSELNYYVNLRSETLTFVLVKYSLLQKCVKTTARQLHCYMLYTDCSTRYSNLTVVVTQRLCKSDKEYLRSIQEQTFLLYIFTKRFDKRDTLQ